MTTSGSEPDPRSRDYSEVDSPEKARLLVQSGDLIALMMLPEEFGGYRDPRNIVFVPAFVELLKDKIDNGPVRRLVEEGRVVEYTVSPAYAGKCMVPVSLTIMATSPEMMAHYIPIWGSGLDPRR